MVVGAVSDIGKVRTINQDAYFVSNDLSFPLYIVADGMGGHRAGEIASSMAMDIITNRFLEEKNTLGSEEQVFKLIKNSIEEANTKIYLKSLDDEKYKGIMGTTITMAFVFQDSILIGHVGDSRAYLINQNTITQITEDHSYVNELLKGGGITTEEAKIHPDRHMITKAVGSSSIIEVDLISKSFAYENILLLCSDGLSNMLKTNDILEIINREEDIQIACETLVSLANARGGNDNITVVAIKFNYDEVKK